MRTRHSLRLLLALVLLASALVTPHGRTATAAVEFLLSITPSKTTVNIGDFIAVDVRLESTGDTAVPHLFVFLNTPDAIDPRAVNCPGIGIGVVNSCDLGLFEPGEVAEIQFFVEISHKSPNGPLTVFVIDGDTSLTLAQLGTPVLTIIGPPEILDGPFATAITRKSAIITWITDDPSTSTVFYGLTDEYGQTKGKNKLVTEHQIRLTGLQPGTTYHFQVASTDAEGTVTWFFDLEFTTAP